jgi:hypothetical protein
MGHPGPARTVTVLRSGEGEAYWAAAWECAWECSWATPECLWASWEWSWALVECSWPSSWLPGFVVLGGGVVGFGGFFAMVGCGAVRFVCHGVLQCVR